MMQPNEFCLDFTPKRVNQGALHVNVTVCVFNVFYIFRLQTFFFFCNSNTDGLGWTAVTY